ncbi:MAG: FAD/NAD(P)-binding protein, partial [Chloroflexota bacterium]
MLNWVIVGGGLQGVLLANTLMHEKEVPAKRMRIIDPHPRLCHRWNRLTANTGMRYMRSPQVHHIDVDPYSLQHFAYEFEADEPAFIPPYKRPSYALFQAHTRHVIDSNGLDKLHKQATARHLRRQRRGWCVETDRGNLHARHVVLATGRNQLHIPAWAQSLPNVQHVLSLDFDRSHFRPGEHITVIGRGISAGQVALTLADDHAITLVAREPLRQNDFDSGPCWLGPACLRDFDAADYTQRRQMIGEARQPGTLSQDIFSALMTAHEAGTFDLQQGEVISAKSVADGSLCLTFADASTLATDHIILATGFRAVPPSATWLRQVIDTEGLPTAACGYPMLDESLHWSKGLSVMGPLAELEIGPAATNI